jgi:hypothetical protein
MNFWINSVLAALCALAGLFATVTLLVFMAAGGANLSPAAAQTLARVMWVTGFVGLICLAGDVVAITAGRPLVGSIVGGLPFAAMMVLFVWTAASSG